MISGHQTMTHTHDPSRRLRATARWATLALLGGLLAGCGNVHHVEVGAIPDDYRTNHPIIVSEQERTLDIPVASGDRELTMAARGAIRGYAQRYQANASGTVRIMVPHGSLNAGAAQNIAHGVKAQLEREGVPSNRIITTAYHAAPTGDAAPIRLSYFGITASTGECGKWPEDILADGNENKHYANFGCATQNNLAAQIADPMDLIAPRGSSPIDAERRGTAIGEYQEDGAAL